MQLISRLVTTQYGLWVLVGLISLSSPLMALESDRQEPLEVSANSTDGTLGDGMTTLRGNVDIQQGTLHITADEAEVNKVDGRVNSVTFRGSPASLQQEIEEQGLVKAIANVIHYQVASGLVTLTGNADVQHPQYQIRGETLTYDLNIQHFEGSGDESDDSRIIIRMDPEVFDNKSLKDTIEGEGEGEAKPEIDVPVEVDKDSGNGENS